MIVNKECIRWRQRGAVSLFVVIFSTLLLTVLTVSFVNIMIHDQQQASASDLAQRAYDSATGGVEDAKRAIVKYESMCRVNPSAPSCVALLNSFKNSCNGIYSSTITGTTPVKLNGNLETPLQTTSTDGSILSQAYTCVTIDLNTPDYLGKLKAGQSQIIPIDSTNKVGAVEVSWFTYQDFSGVVPSSSESVSLEAKANMPLYAEGNSSFGTWPKNRPSLVRAQLMQYSDNGFTLSDLDSASGVHSDANTLFLYPSLVGLNTSSFVQDVRRDPANSMAPVICQNSLLGAPSIYACTEKINLPDPIGAGVSTHRNAYLRLSALYNGMSYQVRLLDPSGNPEDFSNVQPSVDSTGRANDIFRRVQSRIDLTGNFAYPDAAVEITGNLCKNFLITNSTSDYKNTCTP